MPRRAATVGIGEDDPMSSAPGEDLHPLVGGFTDAAAYDAGRPRYDRQAVAELTAQSSCAAERPVLELGAGTGQLSRHCSRPAST